MDRRETFLNLLRRRGYRTSFQSSYSPEFPVPCALSKVIRFESATTRVIAPPGKLELVVPKVDVPTVLRPMLAPVAPVVPKPKAIPVTPKIIADVKKRYVQFKIEGGRLVRIEVNRVAAEKRKSLPMKYKIINGILSHYDATEELKKQSSSSVIKCTVKTDQKRISSKAIDYTGGQILTIDQDGIIYDYDGKGNFVGSNGNRISLSTIVSLQVGVMEEIGVIIEIIQGMATPKAVVTPVVVPAKVATPAPAVVPAPATPAKVAAPAPAPAIIKPVPPPVVVTSPIPAITRTVLPPAITRTVLPPARTIVPPVTPMVLPAITRSVPPPVTATTSLINLADLPVLGSNLIQLGGYSSEEFDHSTGVLIKGYFYSITDKSRISVFETKDYRQMNCVATLVPNVLMSQAIDLKYFTLGGNDYLVAVLTNSIALFKVNGLVFNNSSMAIATSGILDFPSKVITSLTIDNENFYIVHDGGMTHYTVTFTVGLSDKFVFTLKAQDTQKMKGIFIVNGNKVIVTATTISYMSTTLTLDLPCIKVESYGPYVIIKSEGKMFTYKISGTNLNKYYELPDYDTFTIAEGDIIVGSKNKLVSSLKLGETSYAKSHEINCAKVPTENVNKIIMSNGIAFVLTSLSLQTFKY